MSLIDLTSMAEPDEELYKKAMSKLSKIELLDCFQCSKCTSGCTSFKLLELTPHEIMIIVKLGFIQKLINSEIIWTCATCLKCAERCPHRSSPYHVIMALRNVAVGQQVKVPEAYLKVVSQILETGLMQPMEKVTSKNMETFDREKLGLPKIRHPTEGFASNFLKALEEHEV